MSLVLILTPLFVELSLCFSHMHSFNLGPCEGPCEVYQYYPRFTGVESEAQSHTSGKWQELVPGLCGSKVCCGVQPPSGQVLRGAD